MSIVGYDSWHDFMIMILTWWYVLDTCMLWHWHDVMREIHDVTWHWWFVFLLRNASNSEKRNFLGWKRNCLVFENELSLLRLFYSMLINTCQSCCFYARFVIVFFLLLQNSKSRYLICKRIVFLISAICINVLTRWYHY